MQASPDKPFGRRIIYNNNIPTLSAVYIESKTPYMFIDGCEVKKLRITPLAHRTESYKAVTVMAILCRKHCLVLAQKNLARRAANTVSCIGHGTAKASGTFETWCTNEAEQAQQR